MGKLKDVCVDCRDPWTLGHWWAEVLGYQVRPHSQADLDQLLSEGVERREDDPNIAVDPVGEPGPGFWFCRVPEVKAVKNRLHIDVYGDADALIGRGAALLDRRPGWTVLADPEGNEFCVFEPPEQCPPFRSARRAGVPASRAIHRGGHMADQDTWAMIAAERAALADDLRALDDAAWDTPSLCTGWSVRDVLVHMTATAMLTPASFFPKLIGSGFSLTKMQAKAIDQERGTPPAKSLARFEAAVGSTKHPPGPTDTWLGETLVHAEDIRRPLGIARQYATPAATRVADFYKGSNLIIGAKKRVAGLRLRATDTEWSTGEGPEVEGPIMALVVAMAGRKAALADLSGEGLAALSSRV